MSELRTKNFKEAKINKRESGLMGLSPLPALIITAVYATAVISVSRYNISVMPGLALYPALLAGATGAEYKRLFRHILPVLPLILLTGGADIYLNREPAALFCGITVTYGFISFLTLLSKALLTVTALVLLVHSYGEEELAEALVSAGLPAVMASSLVLTIRYTGELKREAAAMVTAWRARACGARPELKSAGPLLAAFFIRCAERAKCTSRAMKCRGWSAEVFLTSRKNLTKKELLTFTALLLPALLPRVINIYKLSEKLFIRSGI